MITTLERFMAKVDKSGAGGCWIWLGCKHPFGYGFFGMNGKNVGSHRAAYELFVGQIPDGLIVMHRCDNPACVKPAHLMLGTQADNMADMKEKGRHLYGTKSPRAVLSEDQAKAIKATPKTKGSGIELARRFGVSPQTVSYIRSGRLWSHLCASTKS